MADGGLAAVGASAGAALRYRVEGMDCPSCAAKIETAVARIEGAENIRVNYGTQTLALRLDEAATPRAAVEAQVRKLGYGIAPIEAPRIEMGEANATVLDEVHGRARLPAGPASRPARHRRRFLSPPPSSTRRLRRSYAHPGRPPAPG